MEYIPLLLVALLGGCEAWTCLSPQKTQLTAQYDPIGTVSEMLGMRTYVTGSPLATKVLIGIHDIYGLDSSNNNTKQIADDLANGTGFKVILPDFLDGDPWTTNSPPHPLINPEYQQWMERHSWETSVRDKVQKLLEYLKGQALDLGMFGFSFGGHKAGQASIDFGQDLKVVGRFVPAPIFMQEAPFIRAPTIILRAAFNELDYDEYCREVEQNLGEGTCEYKILDVKNPGYAGSEGNWTNGSPEKVAAETAVNYFKDFLCRHFPPQF